MYRQVTLEDYDEIAPLIRKQIEKVQKRGTKSWFADLDAEAVLGNIFYPPDGMGAFIVDDAYLVVFEIGTPWYAHPDTYLVYEKLVLRIRKGGEFKNVPAFLGAVQREAGARRVVAGTALAPVDAPLASLYQKHGFNPETTLLVWSGEDTNGEPIRGQEDREAPS